MSNPESRMAMVNSNVDPDLNNSPGLEALCEALSASSGKLSEISHLERVFTSFVDSSEPIATLNRAVATLAKDHQYTPRSFLRESFVFFQDANYSLYLQRLKPQTKRVLTTAPSSAIVALMRPDAQLPFRSFALPPDTDMSVFSAAITLEERDNRVITKRDGPVFYYANEVVDFSPLEDTVIMKLVENTAVSYQWAFEYRTLAPLFICASLPSISRFETLIDLIREFDGSASTQRQGKDVLIDLCSHPLHFVRWKAAQALARVDRQATESVLSRMINDPHPHISKAAASALDKLRLAVNA